jgi:hypothetical protein
MAQFDFDNALQRLAERRIEEAMREGKFDHLPGSGQPLDLDAMPVDENARMIWWAMRLMKNERPTPQQVAACARIEALKGELAVATTEARVRVLVGAINALVAEIEAAGRGVRTSPVAPLDVAGELWRLGRRRWAATPGMAVALDLRACANRLCESANPADARFCRRCGAAVAIPGRSA